jgi:hypothetical protein
VVEHLPSILKALGSTPNIRNEEREGKENKDRETIKWHTPKTQGK